MASSLFLDIYNKIECTRRPSTTSGSGAGSPARLDQLDLKERFYSKPMEHAEGKRFGATEAAAQAALAD